MQYMIGGIVAYCMVYRSTKHVISDQIHKYESVSQFIEIKGITQTKVFKYN